MRKEVLETEEMRKGEPTTMREEKYKKIRKLETEELASFLPINFAILYFPTNECTGTHRVLKELAF